MNTQDFCYWLQGYFELSQIDEGLSKEQVEVIKEHLQLVFKKETTKTVPVKEGRQGIDDLLKRFDKVSPAPMPIPQPPHLEPSKWKFPYDITCSSGSVDLTSGVLVGTATLFGDKSLTEYLKDQEYLR